MKGLVSRLFSIRDIKSALNIDIALSQPMLDKIESWQRMYSGTAPWVKDGVSSLRLEAAVCRELSNIVLSEMNAKVSDNRLDNLFRSSVRDINIHFQKGLVKGNCIFNFDNTDEETVSESMRQFRKLHKFHTVCVVEKKLYGGDTSHIKVVAK